MQEFLYAFLHVTVNITVLPFTSLDNLQKLFSQLVLDWVSNTPSQRNYVYNIHIQFHFNATSDVFILIQSTPQSLFHFLNIINDSMAQRQQSKFKDKVMNI